MDRWAASKNSGGKERKMMGLAVASMWEAALNKTTTTP